MNRLEFLLEIKKGFVETVKGLVYPILSEEAEKLEASIDRAFGLQWVEIPLESPEKIKGKMDFCFNGLTCAIFPEKGQLKAVQTVCKHCRTVVQWIAYEKTFKCFQCEKSYSLIDEEQRDLPLKELPVKNTEGKWYLGIVRRD